jgi:hypothetical protein
MLFEIIEQILCSLLSYKQFPLSDYNILLEIMCRLIRNTEIFHLCRHFDLEFLADSKEMINGIPARKNNCSMLEDINLLLPEFLGRNRLYFDKLPKIYLQLILLRKKKVRGVRICRFGLGN